MVKSEKLALILLLMTVALALGIGRGWQIRQQWLAWLDKKAGVTEQIDYWQQVTNRFPNAAEGWLELTGWYLKNGQIDLAQETLNKAKLLSPHHQEIPEWEKKLGEN